MSAISEVNSVSVEFEEYLQLCERHAKRVKIEGKRKQYLDQLVSFLGREAIFGLIMITEIENELQTIPILAAIQPRLTVLRLSFSRTFTLNETKAIAGVVSQCLSLQELGLGFSELPYSQQTTCLFNAIAAHPSLEEVELKIAPKSARSFNRAFKNGMHLRQLDLSNFPLNQRRATELAEVFMNNTTLQSLSLSAPEETTASGLPILIETVLSMGLRKFTLHDYKVNRLALDGLARLLASNATVEDLYVDRVYKENFIPLIEVLKANGQSNIATFVSPSTLRDGETAHAVLNLLIANHQIYRVGPPMGFSPEIEKIREGNEHLTCNRKQTLAALCVEQMGRLIFAALFKELQDRKLPLDFIS